MTKYVILYVIQLSDRVYNVTFPASDIYSLRRIWRSRREYISEAGNVTLYTLSDS